MIKYLIMYVRDWALTKIMRSFITHYSPKLVYMYKSLADFRKFYFEVLCDRYCECYYILYNKGYSWIGERYRRLARTIFLDEKKEGGRHHDH